jgi:hypothetical protein
VVEFLAEDPLSRQSPKTNSSHIRQAGASLQYLSSSPLPCAPPDAHDRFYSQRNSVIDERPKHTSARAPPATPLLLIWTQSRTRTTFPSSSCPPEGCCSVTVIQESPELAGDQPPGRRPRRQRRNPNPMYPFLLCLNCNRQI